MLEILHKKYEIIIFTAAAKFYALPIIKIIDPKNQYFKYVFTRNECLSTKNGFFIKDLRILGNRNLEDIVIVDDLVHSFGFQLDNGIPILEFRGNNEDNELKFLTNYLLKLADAGDVREFNRKHLQLAKLERIAIFSGGDKT